MNYVKRVSGVGREGENRPLGEHRMKSNDVAKSMLFTMHAHTHTDGCRAAFEIFSEPVAARAASHCSSLLSR